MEKTIPVVTKSHSYEVRIVTQGLANLLGEIQRVWSPRKVALITDENVGPLYAAKVQQQLSKGDFAVQLITIPAGEASKSWEFLEKIIQQLAAGHFSRHDGVLALGGGVVGDLAGLAASIYLRGIAFIQVPTSLLAQVDSSVGGKTAIDLPAGKNLVGTFYQPDLVLIDPTVLTTLKRRCLVEGYGEVVKCAALVGGNFWQLTGNIENYQTIRQVAAELIEASVRFKAQVVAADETESHQRQLLNFGHTLGHAVEQAAAGRLFHGEAVAIGLYQLSRLFERRHLTAAKTTAQIAARLKAVGLPLSDPQLGTPAFYQALQHDKKISNQQLTLIYLKQIGQPDFYRRPLNQIITWLQQELLTPGK